MISPVELLVVVASVYAANYLFRPVAFRVGLLDIPGGRKKHAVPTPLIGGVIIYVGMLFGYVITYPPSELIIALMIGAGLMLGVGVIDDLRGISPVKRLLAEFLVAVLVIGFGGLNIENTGILPIVGNVELGVLGVPITAVAVVGMINSFNMMDGIDGLGGGVVAVALGALLMFQFALGSSAFIDFTSLVLASVGVFLLKNLGLLSSVKIFLGDAGSMMLGFCTIVLLLAVAQESSNALSFSAVDALWCVALPLFDTFTIMLRRVLKGQHPFHPDRTHLHHIVMRMGFSAREALYLILAVAVLYAVAGLLIKQLAPQLSLLVFMALGVWYLRVMTRSWRLVRFVKRFRRKYGV
ncbi:undecaprenyl-phosphate alpha-N-acetylglucosaminyl 1-phosphate transferase [Umboniibacter marinipuniceus]|uniref:UDP-GlcNAc:undecaprenyl-phosphate GlcNAc-1-phosphate transferase n=1 Tax=Umboniibacter marinipuniceus TaxID=569599 RepID=A0A3M0A9N5_9GAMM|nr:undecaprenyl-phosphate alpha-N-acetylglucosaminyl 1-phosphate transferase [Umboniibacter marinipuniceus]RMA79548.1 UDP-GlcNAc:undecaprenyl-phosphate GlcNAc-1-phosphate transferase [Umboniibacter marinipuniceus]